MSPGGILSSYDWSEEPGEVSSIGQVLTSGKRTFDEFLIVLRRADRFRGLVAGKAPNSDLLKECHRAIAEKTFLDKLPGKSLRFAFFTGGGIALDSVIGGGLGTAAGAALGAADTFLLEKLGLGWKPHHFVTGELRQFVLGHVETKNSKDVSNPSQN